MRRLIETALAAIADTENLLANRANVINGLMEFGVCLPDDLADQILSILIPLARGDIKEPTSVQSAAMTENPLNPYKFRTGTPSNLRGVALRALARIGKQDVVDSRPSIQPILEDALGDLDSEVRRFAFAAARAKPKRCGAVIMAVVLGTRDPDSSAAASAFAALANKTDLRLTRSQWQLFLYTVKMASQSPDAPLRRHACSALSRLIPQMPNTVLRAKADNLLSSFATDICASVREAASQHEAET